MTDIPDPRTVVEPALLILPGNALTRAARALVHGPAPPEDTQGDALVHKLVELGFTIDDYTDVAGTHRGMVFARR